MVGAAWVVVLAGLVVAARKLGLLGQPPATAAPPLATETPMTPSPTLEEGKGSVGTGTGRGMAPSETPSPTQTPRATATETPASGGTAPVEPTATAVGSPTPTGTATATPTALPAPSPTPSPEPTATPTPLPTPASTEAPGEGEETLPETGGLPETTLALLVPLYTDPAQHPEMWQAVAQARQTVRVVAVINPQNGPGVAAPPQEYRQALQNLVDAGVVLVGYVPTDGGRRSSEAIRSDINLYDAFYPVQGVLFDDVPPEAEYVGRFTALYQYARAFFPDGPIFFNFGTLPAGEYFQADGLSMVIFEDDASRWAAFSPPEWMAGADTAVWVYGVPDVATMQAIMDEVRTQNWAQYVYLTDDTPPDPWDRLPSFWEALVAQTAQ